MYKINIKFKFIFNKIFFVKKFGKMNIKKKVIKNIEKRVYGKYGRRK